MIRIRADFNGCFDGLLCLSHSDTAIDEGGDNVVLAEGLDVLAFEEDVDSEGRPAFLIAAGVVERAPQSLECSGSRWCLRIDARGIRHAPTLDES